jgi:hypothetical protein
MGSSSTKIRCSGIQISCGVISHLRYYRDSRPVEECVPQSKQVTDETISLDTNLPQGTTVVLEYEKYPWNSLPTIVYIRYA